LTLNLLAAYVPSITAISFLPPPDSRWLYALAPIILPIDLMGSLIRDPVPDSLILLAVFLTALVVLTVNTWSSRTAYIATAIVFAYSFSHGLILYAFAIR
jgi:hypothetical protein